MAGRFEGDESVREYFPSKRDWWLTAVIWSAVAGLIWATFLIAASQIPTWAKIPFMLANLVSVVLSLWTLYGTGYVLTGDSLVAHCGPFRSVLPLAGIQEIVVTNNPLASPACSLDRLHLKGGGSGLLVSPLDRNGFIVAMARRCAQLKVQEEAWRS